MMDKEQLIKSAEHLIHPSQKAACELQKYHDLLANKFDIAMMERDDLETLIGPHNREMMQSNHKNHLYYIESLFSFFDPVQFVDTVVWVFITYRKHGFSPAYWPVMLEAALNIMQDTFTADVYEEVRPLYQWLKKHVPDFKELSNHETMALEQKRISHG